MKKNEYEEMREMIIKKRNKFLDNLIRDADGNLIMEREAILEGLFGVPMTVCSREICDNQSYIAKIAGKMGYRIGDRVKYRIIVYSKNNQQ